MGFDATNYQLRTILCKEQGAGGSVLMLRTINYELSTTNYQLRTILWKGFEV
jgi:hypothetical protein